MSETENEKDSRTLKILRKYFDFFKFRGYLPKKWKKHIAEHFDRFFTDRDKIESERTEKDNSLDTLSINGILDILQGMSNNWNSTAEQLSEIVNDQENKRQALQDSYSALADMLESENSKINTLL